MNYSSGWLYAIVLVGCSGCATAPVTSSDSRPITPSRLEHTPTASNAENAARVTVVRDSGSYGSAVSVALRLDGVPVAAFRTRESLTFTVNPGERVFGLSVNPKLGTALKEYSLTAKAGEHYFYRISATADGFILQRSFEVSR